MTMVRDMNKVGGVRRVREKNGESRVFQMRLPDELRSRLLRVRDRRTELTGVEVPLAYLMKEIIRDSLPMLERQVEAPGLQTN